jgi:hypothetical protein
MAHHIDFAITRWAPETLTSRLASHQLNFRRHFPKKKKERKYVKIKVSVASFRVGALIDLPFTSNLWLLPCMHTPEWPPFPPCPWLHLSPMALP